MEEAVGKLTTGASGGPDWPYALVWLHKGTCHGPLPKEGHFGILPQRGEEETPCGWISQLEVCQLLIASTQVAYPVGLNGYKEPIIISLPEPLAKGISLTAGKPVYLEINIPPSPMEEPDQKVLPIGEVSTIMIASPISPPPKSGEGSMTMEVRNLLSQAVLETFGCRSKNSTLRRPNPVVILMPPPHKPKELFQLLDTLSQVSTEMAEASLEGIPTRISPIAMTSRSRSVTPLADATESIKEAKAICSQATLGAQALCFATVKEAKITCVVTVKEAKTTQACTIWEAKAACSTTIRDAEAWRASQAKLLQREHGNIMWGLEMRAIQEESRSQANFLSPWQAALYTSPAELKSTLVASYHLLLGQTPPSHPFILLQRASPVEEQPASAASPTPVPKQSPRPKRQHPSPDPVDSTPLGRTTSKVTTEGPLSSKQQEISHWDRAFKPSHAEAFGRDSDLVKEARKEFFSKHSYNFVMEGTHDLSEIFRQMATSTELLGTSIYEIQASRMGPDELKEAYYALRSLPKGLKFLHAVPPSESPKLIGLVEINDPDALCHFSCITHCPGVVRRTRMRGPWSITYRQCSTGWAWYATNAMIACP